MFYLEEKELAAKILQDKLERAEITDFIYKEETAYRVVLKGNEDDLAVMLLQSELPPQRILSTFGMIEAYWHTIDSYDDEVDNILAKFYNATVTRGVTLHDK